MSEYIPILGGIGVVVLISVSVIGKGVEGVYSNVNCAVENRDGTTSCEAVEVADSELPGDSGDESGGETTGGGEETTGGGETTGGFSGVGI